MRTHIAILSVALLACTIGCSDDGSELVGPDGSANSAVITGRVVSPDGSSKVAACTDAIITLNGVPAAVEFDSDCGFVVTGIQPADLLQVRIELPELGVSGIVEIDDVQFGELIEIEVEATDERLSIVVLRREHFEPADLLPTVITSNNVHILIGDGFFDQDLTVRGNNFGLLGQAGADCDAPGWSVISGDVLVLGNNATFRNIAFTGDVTVRGNNVRFINTCFDGELVRFGHGIDVDDDDDDDDNRGDDDDDEEDDD